LQEGAANRLDHTEFLELVLADELAVRQARYGEPLVPPVVAEDRGRDRVPLQDAVPETVGKLVDGVFVAEPDSLVTKCPSKYAPKKSA